MLKIRPVIMATEQMAAVFCIPATVIRDSMLSRKEVYGFNNFYSLMALTFHSHSILKEGNSYEGNANI